MSNQTPPNNKCPEPGAFTGECYQTFKEESVPIFQKQFLKTEEDGTLPTIFMRTNCPDTKTRKL